MDVDPHHPQLAALYAVLSDEQKKEADALLSLGDHRGERGGDRQRQGHHGSRWH